jgi:putative ABC transport system permease protein
MLYNYLKIAWRVLLRRKFFTFISLFAISFTLITLMVFVALLDHVMGPHTPEVNRDRTLIVNRIQMEGDRRVSHTSPGYGLLDGYMRDLPGIEEFSIVSESPVRVTSFLRGEKVKFQMRRTDGAFWRLMGFQFVEGGPFTDEDDRNRNALAVLSESARKRLFGKNSVVGRMIRLDGQSFRVVGVVEDVPFFRIVPFGEIWVPVGSAKTDSYRSKLAGGFMGLFLKDRNTSFSELQEAFDARLQQIAFPDPSYDKLEARLETPFESLTRPAGLNAQAFVGMVVLIMILFMVLPAVNLVNLNLSRIMERRGEIGVRRAFGAPSAVLAVQFLVENLLLTMLGGILGFIGSVAVLKLLEHSGAIPFASFQVNARIFLYSLAATIFFGVFSGVYPAWKMSSLNPVEALSGGGR